MSVAGERMGEVEDLRARLHAAGYVAERDLAAAILLMADLERPLLVEGDAGVGQTEVAKALAAARGARLIRLQCYEGLDAHAAMYEWNYQRQLLAIKLLEDDARPVEQKEHDIFSERYLLKRPLLEAISCDAPPVLLIDEVDRADEAFEAYLLERPLLAAIRRAEKPVLLIDEVDRADEEFEAFLLELLSDYQVSIPELGTITARSIPRVVLTSNGTRELSDALRRRCLYHYVDFPDIDREARILLTRLPGIDAGLALQVARLMREIRRQDLRKVPGVVEALDWAATLAGLGVHDLRQEPEAVYDTLACVLKTHEDRENITREVTLRLLSKVA